ncbi:transducin beta-like protein 3 isoform X1 [Pocillopora verrucosa]|uniref:transducin beta-like protein 3 isoform X1 n=1 Tax=Pocillopora verrucosa TaxID=203993 RepID=UPI003340B2B5
MAQMINSGPGALLISNYEVSSKIDAFYTGGKVQFSSKEDHLFCTCNDKVQVVHVETGKVVHTLQEEGDVISCFAASPDDKFCVTASKSLLLRQWEWNTGEQIRTWKAVHRAPIVSMTFDATSTLLATGSSDSTVKVWDIIKQYYTHNFKGSQGVVNLVSFHPNTNVLQLFSASDDCKIRVWDLKKSRCVAVLESHFSVVTSLAFSQSGETMISSSRDNVLNMWDVSDKKLLKTIPAFEGVESVITLPKGSNCPGCKNKEKEYFMTAGSKGQLRVWSFRDGKCVFTETVLSARRGNKNENNNDEDGNQQIVHATLCRNLDQVAVVTFDHNIVFHELESLKRTKQFVGYNDEILDLSFVGDKESHLSVATNSSQLRIYELASMNCQLLEGHTDIVLALEINSAGDMLVTGSKDNTVRVWQMNKQCEFRCVGTGLGHTHAVHTVAWSRLDKSFVASGSQDNTVKIWKIPPKIDDLDSPIKLSVKLTEKAHDKGINSVTISPNDKLMATGSQDKTAKIWMISNGSLLGTLRGHKKGIWCVRFSPVDQCLATSSADSTIKIWALSDFTCVKTLEGHTSSVLKICFLTRGMQLVSSGSEGLLKLWTIKTNECVKTFDQHLDKVWSIAVNKNQDQLISGGADSVINIWKDVTEIEQEQAQAVIEENILKQQELSNLIADKNYLQAISLAITLEQPFRVMNIVKDILLTENGTEELTKAIKSFREDQLDAMLRFIVEWNTNSKNCHVAQSVLSIILRNNSPYDLMKKKNIKDTMEALLSYSEKHFQRMDRLLQQMEFIEYTWQSMKLSGPLMLTTPRTASTTSGSASTSDSAIDSRLRVLDDNSREQGTSDVPHDVPSIPDHSRSDEAVEEEDEKSTGNGTDIHEDDDNETMNGASDHDDFENESQGDIVRGATQNGHVVGLKDRNTVQNESSDDMSDRDSKKRKSSDREGQFEIRTKGDVVPDISTKKRKTNRASEGFKVKKKTKVKVPQQRTMKIKTRTGLGVKSRRKIKLKTKTA